MPYSRLPAELRSLHQWLVWRYEDVPDSKPTKVPYNPRTGYPASVTDPRTWVSFDEAVEALRQSFGGYAGIGFVFTDNDPYCGIDLDSPHDPETGESLLSPEDGARQQLIFSKMDSYSERSPSGNGLHIIVKAHVPHGRKRQMVEVYSSGRFFTMTGDVYHNAPIADRQELVQLLWSEMGPAAQPNYYAGDYTETYSDEDIFRQASQARNGDLFMRLWNGDITGYFSASEADFALIDIIAFYTKHRIQIKRMFLASALGKREKYTKAKPGRLTALIGYMVNKSFDRMLPPVDLAGVLDQFNAALAATRNAASVGADHQGPVLPRPAQTDHAPATFYEGMSTDMWRTTPPPGLLGSLVTYIYHASPRPTYEISLAAALGLMSGICGRAFNVSGTGLNHYMMLLAVTGTGKEAMSTAINRLMTIVAKDIPSAMQFIGPAELASGQGLLKHLAERETPCFVSLVGEFGLRLQQMTHPNASTSDIALRRVMLDLFNKSGAGNMVHPTVYSDKKNNTDVIHSPAFSLLGDTTPETFYKALDEDTIIQGLLPRFTIIEYTGPRVDLNEQHNTVMPDHALVAAIGNLAKQCHENMASGKILDIGYYPDAADMLRELDRYATRKINASGTDTLRQLWNRFHLKILKLAGLLAIAHNSFEPVISLPMVEWARSLVLADTLNLLSKFESGSIGVNSDHSEQHKLLRELIKRWMTTEWALLPKNKGKRADLHAAKLVPHAFISANCLSRPQFAKDKRGATNALHATIKSMIASGYIQQVSNRQLETEYNIKFNGEAYAPTDISYFLEQ